MPPWCVTASWLTVLQSSTSAQEAEVPERSFDFYWLAVFNMANQGGADMKAIAVVCDKVALESRY